MNAFDVNMRYWGPEKQEEVNKTEKEALREFFASLFFFFLIWNVALSSVYRESVKKLTKVMVHSHDEEFERVRECAGQEIRQFAGACRKRFVRRRENGQEFLRVEDFCKFKELHLVKYWEC